MEVIKYIKHDLGLKKYQKKKKKKKKDIIFEIIKSFDQ